MELQERDREILCVYSQRRLRRASNLAPPFSSTWGESARLFGNLTTAGQLFAVTGLSELVKQIPGGLRGDTNPIFFERRERKKKKDKLRERERWRDGEKGRGSEASEREAWGPTGCTVSGCWDSSCPSSPCKVCDEFFLATSSNPSAWIEADGLRMAWNMEMEAGASSPPYYYPNLPPSAGNKPRRNCCWWILWLEGTACDWLTLLLYLCFCRGGAWGGGGWGGTQEDLQRKREVGEGGYPFQPQPLFLSTLGYKYWCSSILHLPEEISVKFLLGVFFLIYFCLAQRGWGWRYPYALVCMQKHCVLALTRDKKRESDGGETGEENLLGMRFCSVEDRQLDFLF